MKYLSVIDCTTRKRLAFLENAYKIGYVQEKNALWTGTFTLPLSDDKNKYCTEFNWVEFYDGDRYIGLFRIIPRKLTKNSSTKEIVYECEHVLATLLDDVLVGWHEIGNRGVYTSSVLRYILDRQTTHNWQLLSCEFSRQYLYGWENENLLTALFSVTGPFLEDYKWEFDTRSYPWSISLKRVSSETKADIRYGKNMLGIEKSSDASNICTRLYPFGYGEGDNQLNVRAVNPTGQLYVQDATAVNTYGVISKIWIDKRYENPQALYDAAMATLNEVKAPTVTYSVQAAHFGQLQNCSVGDIVRVADDEDGIDLYLPIVKIQKSDVKGNPMSCTIELGQETENVASTIADLNDRQRIQEAYSQGAVTLYTSHFADNCSSEYPAEMSFYIPENAVHINQVLLNGKASAFRAYSKATKGGGAQSNTTASGGGTTSGAGGSGTATSSNTSQTTNAGNASADTGYTSIGTEKVKTESGGTDNHTHDYIRPKYETISGVTYAGRHYHNYDSSHSHSIPGHSHSISLNAHTHSIPAHSHNFSVPDHTHDIEYGIYKGEAASQLTVKADGNTVGTYNSSTGDVNLIGFLARDEGGNVRRGWHTIQIVPDKLTRVELTLVTQLFSNSRGGGQY